MRGWAAVLLLVIVVGSVVSQATAAGAHGQGESDESRQLVLQAIAYIVDDSGNHEAILDKIKDAQRAKHKEGVALDLVAQAQDLFEATDVHQARSLLERSIGARPHRGTGEPAPIREVGPPPKGAEAGRAVPSDTLPGRDGLDGADWAVLAGFLAIGAVGVLLAVRMRSAKHGVGT